MRQFCLLGAVLLLSLPAHAVACWDEAAQRYGISPQLLYAIAQVESGLKPQALNLTHHQRTSSYDIGLMQINSSNLPALARYGITAKDLYNPCTSIHVGAWLLAQTFAKHGLSWDGVGAYNAACTQLKGQDCQRARSRYAWQVYRRLHTPKDHMQAGPVAPSGTAEPTGASRFTLTARVSP